MLMNIENLKIMLINFIKYDESKLINNEADEMNSTNKNKLEKWLKSRRNGGNGPSGMKARLEIVEELCCN